MQAETDLLPTELKKLVHWAVDKLGQTILKHEGQVIFEKTETLRLAMKDLRTESRDVAFTVLKAQLKDLQSLSPHQQFMIAHGFALMLELMNACESAYRTLQIRSKPLIGNIEPNRSIVFVLTAHPTESRSREVILIFEAIQRQLIEALDSGFEHVEHRFVESLSLAWNIALAKNTRPKVEDEAEYIYSILFRKDVFAALLMAGRKYVPIFIRTWVGGDKDGHPGVDEKAMLKSLELSRKHLVRLFEDELKHIGSRLSLLNLTPEISAKANVLLKDIKNLMENIGALKKITASDGIQIKKIREQLKQCTKRFQTSMEEVWEPWLKLNSMLAAFPALVVPLEFRESSDVIADAVATKKQFAIQKMLRTLASISSGANPVWYVRGFVISMANSANDIANAAKLIRAELGGLFLPIIPLLENAYALSHAKSITSNILQMPDIIDAAKKHWHGRFEVMVGYSDSSKENGAFPSRLLISQALGDVVETVTAYQLEPVLFHGSGGSVERGGGSIQEQTEWWPEELFRYFKETVQGETIQRTFATPEILKRQVARISFHKANAKKMTQDVYLTLEKLAKSIQENYRKKVHDETFLNVIAQATPYKFVSLLKIGSRPSARVEKVSVEGLRAIPWILCWTQTRILFPTWWGVGCYWNSINEVEKEKLKYAYQESGLFRSYIKQLGFTLAKVRLPIWNLYLDSSTLPSNVKTETYQSFVTEFDGALRFVREVSGQNDLLWFRPWLAQSIQLRSAMIHPLNLLQLIALKNNDERLLRETVTGIACGMLATG